VNLLKNIVFWGLFPGLIWYSFGFWKGFEVASSPQVKAFLAAKEATENVPNKVKEFFGGKQDE
jgi:hypothetical protein